MDSDGEMSLSMAIETGLSAQYHLNPDLTDGLCVLGLDNAIVALKQRFGFAKNETVLVRPDVDGIVAHVVAIGFDRIGQTDDLTLKEYVAVVNKTRKSVVRHSSYGPRAYLDFVKDYV